LAWRRTVVAWVYVPIGLLCILLACWGVDCLIALGTVSFPASVALLIVLFFGLILSQSVLGDKRTKKVVRFIDIPVRYHGQQGRMSCAHIEVVGICSSIHQCLFHTIFRSVIRHFGRRSAIPLMNIVVLPLSPAISRIEVGKIIGVFCIHHPYVSSKTLTLPQ